MMNLEALAVELTEIEEQFDALIAKQDEEARTRGGAQIYEKIEDLRDRLKANAPEEWDDEFRTLVNKLRILTVKLLTAVFEVEEDEVRPQIDAHFETLDGN